MRKKDGKPGKGVETLTQRKKKEASSIAASISERVENSYSENEIIEAEDTAMKKYRGRKALSALWDRIRVLFFIAKHPKVWGLPVAVPAAVAVLYLVLPFDAVPDAIVGVGLMDDVFVITGMIPVIVKTVSSYTKEKLLEIRSQCPADVLPAFDSMFKVDETMLKTKDSEDMTVEDADAIVEDRVDYAVHNIEKGLRGTKHFISAIHDQLETEAASNPSIRNSKLYRLADRANTYAEALAIEGKRIAVRALEDYLNLMLLKKGVKSLISFTMFALALFFFSLKSTSLWFLVPSSFCMLLSYGFFIHSVIKTVPKCFHFIKGYISGGLEGGVTAFIFSESAGDPGLKEQLVKCGVKKIKNDRALQKVLLASFGKTLAVFLLRIGLIAVSVFALKRLVILTTGLSSSFEILFAPLVEFFELLKR